MFSSRNWLYFVSYDEFMVILNLSGGWIEVVKDLSCFCVYTVSIPGTYGLVAVDVSAAGMKVKRYSVEVTMEKLGSHSHSLTGKLAGYCYATLPVTNSHPYQDKSAE